MISSIKNFCHSVKDALSSCAIDIPHFKTPSFLYLEERIFKIAAIALSSACFFYTQMKLGKKAVLGITAGCTALAITNDYLSQKYKVLAKLSAHPIDIKTPLNELFPVKDTAIDFFRSLAEDLPFAFYNAFTFAPIPPTVAAISLKCIQAPIVEEFLFRGLLQEGLESALVLTTDKISNKQQALSQSANNPISSKHILTTATIIQSVTFGYAHRQYPPHLQGRLTLRAYFRTALNKRQQSLLPGIIQHALNNAKVVITDLIVYFAMRSVTKLIHTLAVKKSSSPQNA